MSAEPVTLPWPTHPAADLFPLIDGEDLQELADDVAANGLIEPVWLYDDPEHGRVLLDGRNRAYACQIAGVEIATRVYTGDDPVTFSLSWNLKRRHLTEGQKAAVAAQAEHLYAEEARKRQAEAAEATNRKRRGDDDSTLVANRPQAQPESTPEPRKSRERAAKTAGTSGRSVGRWKHVEREAPDLADKVRSGEMALGRAERIIRDRQAEAERVERARREAEQAPEPTRVDVWHGDFRDVLAHLTDVDAIVTDPPYGHDALDLLDDLAAWADKVLTDDGVLAVLLGQSHLPDAYRRLDGHRPYRWTACYLTSGPAYVSHAARVQSQWKPLLVYGDGPRFSDVVTSSGDDKRHHQWGQNYDAFYTIIERLTERGQTVADPFMGGGTTLLAAHALGRHAVGCDTDAEAVDTARERLS